MMELGFRRFAAIFSTLGLLIARPSAALAAPAEGPPKDKYDGPPTLVGTHKAQLGGYGGIGTAYTRMLGREGALVSLEGALLVGHRLSIGLAAYGFARTPPGPAQADGTPRRFGAGYGGFAARYSVLTDFPVYGTLGFVLGGGAVVLDDDIGRDGPGHDEWHRESFDGFFLFQPEIALQSNITRWFRVGVTGGYRLTSGVDRFGLQSSDLNGFLVGGNLQFGWF